nr:uncharacterized protein LOC112024917 [Quercus suber]
MRDDETLKVYLDKYWEIYNELDGKYDDVAINMFKNGLPMGHGLRKSLTGKPATSVRQLMDRIDKYKRVEEDLLQGKGKEKAIPQEKRDSRWPNKMSGDPEKRNQDRYCQYHQDHGHATEDCRNLWNYLDQLVRKGRLKHLLHHSSSQQGQNYQEPRRDTAMG